ncbi:MAG: hypothetical protein JSS74_09890 [Actinobacteria bacterium]|nr:hypothetical protein [Actinomycetota bacterium]
MKHPADNPVTYEFRVSGRLDPHWAAHFEGLTLTPDSDGTTSLRGQIADQAALHGVLQRLRDAGLSIVGITQIDP